MELLLDDLLSRDLLGLLEEDVGDAGRVRSRVEAAAALRRELGEERVRAAAGPDRREGDPGGLHPLDDLGVLAGARPAVGQQDDVAPRGLGALERLHGLAEAGEDVRLAERLDATDRALEVADVAERLGLDDPVRRLVERDHADLVARGHRRGRPQDRLLADVDLADATHPGPAALTAVERVAVAGVHRARLVDHDDEGHVRLLLAVPDAHVDRQRLLDRRLLVAAGAVRVRAADHDESLAEVAHVDLQREHLAVGQRRPRDVDEDDRVVRGEDERVAREALRPGSRRPSGAPFRARRSAPPRRPRRPTRRASAARPGRSCSRRPGRSG